MMADWGQKYFDNLLLWPRSAFAAYCINRRRNNPLIVPRLFVGFQQSRSLIASFCFFFTNFAPQNRMSVYCQFTQ